MLTAAVIGLLATPSSGAAPSSSLPLTAALVHSERERVATGAPSSTSLRGATQSRSDSCPSARKALTFYRSRVEFWRTKMGSRPLALQSPQTARESRLPSCPRYLAHLWQRKAHAARLAFTRWHRYEFEWSRWLPPAWIALARCETYLTWTWDSGSYVSAFGIYRDGYANDAHRIGNFSWDETLRKLKRYPTPREQWEAALSHYREHGGFSGWGCA